MTDKAAVTRQLDEAWSELREAVDSIPEDRLEERGVVDDWSVKDILGHIAFWSGRAARHLDLIAAGRDEELTGPDGQQEIDEWNSREWSARKDASLAEVRREWTGNHEAARRALASFPDEKLDEPLWDHTVLFGFGADTFAHYKEHTQHIRDWARKQEASTR